MTDPVLSVIVMMKGQGLLRYLLLILSTGFLLAGCQPGAGGVDLSAPNAGTASGYDWGSEMADGHVQEPYDQQSNAASFLMGYRANLDRDISLAADEFNNALGTAPENQRLMALAFQSYFINGDIEAAARLASKSQQLGFDFDYGSEPALVLALQARDWPGALAVADLLLENAGSQPIGTILGAWALAFQNQGDAGLTRLLDLAHDDQTEPPIAIFTQSALIAEYLSRPQDALAAARMAVDQDLLGLTSALTMAGVLARHGDVDTAREILSNRLSSYFNRDAALSALDDGTSPLFNRPGINTLLAEAYVDAANVPLPIRTSRLARAHAARYIAPDHDKINYMLGLYYRDLDQIEKSHGYHERIPKNSIWYQPAQFLKARYFGAEEENYDNGMAIFEELLEGDANNIQILIQKGHAARRHGEYQRALQSYLKAWSLEEDHPTVSYYLGITYDRLDQKEEAERALRRSLEYNGGDVYALNYLGYWLLEEGGDPEEALGFIRQAIELQPQNGYFMDSLGWGYFKLGRFDQALLFMERAVMLRPVDPLITDHLGDVYDALGRSREAVFQWQRALDLVTEGQSDEDMDLEHIKTKIESQSALGKRQN